MNNRKSTALGALTLALCLGAGLFFFRSGFFSLSSPEQLRDYILDFSPYSHLAFFLIQLFSVILAPIPSNISALAGGLLFGTWAAFLLTFAAVVLGSLLVFQLARILGQPFADRLVNRRLSDKYRHLLQTKTSMFLLLAFLFPYFPDDALCILAGLSRISLRRFLALLLLARPWGLLFASALGGSSLSLPLWVLCVFGVLGVFLFVLGMRYAESLEAAVLSFLHRS